MAIAVIEEDGLPVVASLRNVMGQPDCHRARYSCYHVRGKAKACREALWRALSYNAEQRIRALRWPQTI